MKNVIVTGGGGFLGSHLAETLLKSGNKVICVDNFCTGMRSNKTFLENLPQAKNLIFIEADVTTPWTNWLNKVPADIQKDVTHVFHFASPASPPLYQEMAFETMSVNTTGLQEAIGFADSVKARVIFASTSEIYGDPEVHPQPESYWGYVNTMGIRSCYDEAKRFGETIIFTHNWKKNTKHGLVRIFNTYGPRMNPSDGRVIINFLVQAIKGEALTVYGSGKQTRSFCYVEDLVAGIISYAKTEMTTPVNLGNDKEFTIMELAENVQQQFKDKKLSIKMMDLPKDDPKQRRPDLTQAKKILAPWQPKTQLKEGLVVMADWLKTQKEI